MSTYFKKVSNEDYSKFIHLSRYSRWIEDEGRRETWEETVDRYISFFVARNKENKVVVDTLQGEVRDSILHLETMPSMRCLMTAGEALERDNVAGFNCSFDAADSLRVFDEMMYILMCGTGEGFSVERMWVNKMPIISEVFHETDTTIVVKDSKIGWAKAYREFVHLLYAGQIPKWDVSGVRPAGARLKTFGGRASGPEPLVDLFKYTINSFRRFAGEQLPTIAVHDILCKVADIVVVGGVRRSALISLSDVDDPYMRKAKTNFDVMEYTLLDRLENGDRKYSVRVDDAPYGERSLIVELGDWESEDLQSNHKLYWGHVHPERQLANNSICYTDMPSMGTFLEEWKALYDSHSGERGIFSRPAATMVAEKNGRRDPNHKFGTNPCSEIILRPKEFCNLSEVVVRSDDTFEDLKRKVREATILGTLQSTLTDFQYLSKKWTTNTEEERLLGVSLTGIMDSPIMNGSADIEGLHYGELLPCAMTLPEILNELKEVAIETNKEWAGYLGISESVAITCVKPSGTVSQLVDSASGIHPRYSDYYIRTVRTDKKDPIYAFLKDQGVPVEDANGKEESTAIFSFPIKAPDGSILRNDRSAIEQLELWKIYAEHWCEHKPSITVYVKEEEWLKVGAWVYENMHICSGVSFLPFDGGTYKQAPYQECTEEEYEAAMEVMPESINWSKLGGYETEDTSTVGHELACSSGGCDIL